MKKSILITGCSSGIGYDAAHGMRDAGWRVFASCRKQADCDRMIGEGFESPLLDYNDTATLESGLAEVLAATGGTLNALFNNGGFGTPGAAEDLPREALRANFETNVFGVHDLTTRVIPVMRAQGHGRIVQHSSVLGLVAIRWRPAYNATKFALEGLTDTLRIEMADTNIKIVTMNTGPVTSKIREKSIPHFEKWIDWENSPRRDQYERGLRKRLYEDTGPDAFELPASAVTAKLLKACTHPNPKPRYYVTTPTYLMGFLRRILTSRGLDRVLRRA
ncbi:SDR family NAD(P)-dependent oxidoreductase [Octadecabacter sp.]|jgi:NAD(P)-dependent dehydrogenase (short-subunit alcohol dehydrogenase family)|nr:SDR family NAD(P)-dependent oxidoreductase [Octadecabacter sp.]MDC1430294.1 SDR family NAD(P)-dependent oxidoreductase [Octadecabacter sp.]|tara:strand:- start:538 stop:1365 length:828 start_codon:yes stop_codon:yes gene_type:complete